VNILPVSDLTYGFFDPGVAALGRELRDTYGNAQPFPHIVLDGLFPADLLEQCLAHFPAGGAQSEFQRPQEKLKSTWNPDALDAPVRSLFYAFNSRPFVQFLENLTGIGGLIPDPYFLGGGFHQTTNGGKLDVHTDFNLHKPLNLERRINVLIYLNKDWRQEYGGCLELWNEDMTRCVEAIVPQFNRTVVFSTTGSSWHGHPVPAQHPQSLPRRSIALYYYTATWDETSRSQTTHFRPRPNSGDRPDYAVALQEGIREWLIPPGFLRLARRLRGRA
jgi:hypothetical protein